MEKRLTLLCKELEFLLSNAPCEDDCSNEESELYADMANLINSMDNIGIGKEINNAKEKECDASKEKISILGVDAYKISKNKFEIRLINGENITVERKPKHRGKNWGYKVDTQYFSKYSYAQAYIRELIHEKLTGIRYIYHSKHKAPDICGYGKGCRNKECNSMLCTDCPIAEEFHANNDNVCLKYVIR